MKWALKRTGSGEFSPEDIEPGLCTHVVYGLFSLHPERLTIQNIQGSLQKKFLDRLMNMKETTGLKVLLGLGGWGESKNGNYSSLAHSPMEREKFARHAARYLNAYGFDGLNLIWEYPLCWQVSGKQRDV